MSQSGPKGRVRRVTGQADGPERQDSVSTQGPVGKKDAYSQRPSSHGNPPSPSSTRSSQHPERPAPRSSQPQRGADPFSSTSASSARPSRPQSGGDPFRAPGTSSARPSRPQSGGDPFRTPGTSSARPSRPQSGGDPFRPSGNGQGSGTRPNPSSARPSTPSSSPRKKSSILPLLLLLVVVFLFGGRFLGLFGNSSSPSSAPPQSPSQSSSGGSPLSGLAQYLNGSSQSLESVLGGSWFASQNQNTAQAGTVRTDSTRLNTGVASGSREKFTTLLGEGRDTWTLLVYLCGTDLESRGGMATKDLQEMLKASFPDSVRLLVYTGGCTGWKNRQISSSVNQIWEIRKGTLNLLEDRVSTASMTDPSTLSSFIRYAAGRFPASRYGLILWDHGAGAVSGFGYDQRVSSSSMSLAGIDRALKDGGLTFDFVGFDACLMATVENGLMLSDHADYMIASEETEPGIGWYYTNWLTKLGSNPSMSTPEIGKLICDDFVSACAAQTRGQSTTLSVVDLAELSHTVPEKLTAFSSSVSGLIRGNQYRKVSGARSLTREFAASSKADMVDLTDLCLRVGSEEGKALADALRGAVKYNRSGSMTNAYGLSVYFPYRKLQGVDRAVNTYRAIGMDQEYTRAIQDFAALELSGQQATGGSASPLSSIMTSAQASSPDVISQLLTAFLSSPSTGFFAERTLQNEVIQSTVSSHILSPDRLVFRKTEKGEMGLTLTPEEWALVNSAEQNVFFRDGEGYLDLGLDNVFTFDAQGRLIAQTDGSWVTLGDQFAAYYHEYDEGEGEDLIIHGRIPARINNERTDLLVAFDREHPDGWITGIRYIYDEKETDTLAKSDEGPADGDIVELLCDTYSPDYTYQGTHRIGNPLVWNSGLSMGAALLDPDAVLLTYRFTDLFNQEYWSQPIPVDR